MTHKSPGLNPRTPIYSTRTDMSCIIFKKQTKTKHFLTKKNHKDTKNLLSITNERISLISKAWIADVRRIADKLLLDSPLPSF